MSCDRDFGIDHAADHVHALLATFNLDRFRAPFLYEASCIVNRLARFALIRAIRHIGDEQRIFHAAAYSAHVMQHLGDPYR